jgi:uncharacterized repeat protein (TIGR03837 family)
MSKALHWDIFCQVIDNFGDIGVSWRLACQLAQRGQQVRLWLDDASALAWMAPQGHAGVQVRAWTDSSPQMGQDVPGDVLIEAFGCTINPAWVVSGTARAQPAPRWINLEYLSAEAYVARSHGLASPVLSGPAAGLTKWFFYPGFTDLTGGLLRGADAQQRRALVDASDWLAQQGLTDPQLAPPEQTVSLFCYEPRVLPGYLHQLAQGPQRTQLLVTAGRASAAVHHELQSDLRFEKDIKPNQSLDSSLSISDFLNIHFLPSYSQTDYDHLLNCCDLNFVRGEDSLVRALWAGKPFVWHIYPQDDGAHAAKLDAFLDWLDAPQSLRQFHYAWNGLNDSALPAVDLALWTHTVLKARAKLYRQTDLVTQLMRFCE